VRVTRLVLRDLRTYASAQLDLGAGLTVIAGRNGAGKTNLLEGLYVGCTGRSFRTTSDREAVAFGAALARVELHWQGEDGPHRTAVALAPGQPRHLRVDGTPVGRLTDATRPLAGVFTPDRMELVKAGPAHRRAHLDQVVAALWPARAEARLAYGRALAQRNALLARIRAGGASRDGLGAWDQELATLGVTLMAARATAVDELAPRFGACAQALGLDGDPDLAYRPRSRATTARELADELSERTQSDLERGFTGHGPHRDELVFRRSGRELRGYGSQGQQRLGLLALLLAEREAIADTRGHPPLMLLDDAVSELDATRRERLIDLLTTGGGQSVITTTDFDHVPGVAEPGVTRVTVSDGKLLVDVSARADAA
jgi:DNA replication and repair protein RecF